MEEIFWGALDRHFWGGRCVGAFDLLNISAEVWKKSAFFWGEKRIKAISEGVHVSAPLIFDFLGVNFDWPLPQMGGI